MKITKTEITIKLENLRSFRSGNLEAKLLGFSSFYFTFFLSEYDKVLSVFDEWCTSWTSWDSFFATRFAKLWKLRCLRVKNRIWPWALLIWALGSGWLGVWPALHHTGVFPMARKYLTLWNHSYRVIMTLHKILSGAREMDQPTIAPLCKA